MPRTLQGPTLDLGDTTNRIPDGIHYPHRQGHLVFGMGLHNRAHPGEKALSQVGSCFPGTLRMSQNPFPRSTSMIAQPQPLIEVFAAFPALRCGRGQRQPWPAMLSLACWALVCGARRSSASAAWGPHDGARIAPALGFTHNTPGAAPLHSVCRPRDRDAVEAQWGA